MKKKHAPLNFTMKLGLKSPGWEIVVIKCNLYQNEKLKSFWVENWIPLYV